MPDGNSKTLSEEAPLVSIITISKNNALGLEKSLQSIRYQTYQNWKLYIVVGTSTDSTQEIAEEFCEGVSKAQIILQTDSGIYQAMNLGTKKMDSKSKYVIYMNSGDQFQSSNSLSNLVNSISFHECGVVIGGYKIQNGKTYPQIEGSISEIDFTFTRRGGCHQSMIYSTEAVRLMGLYNTDYTIASDHDLTLKVIKHFKGWKTSEIVSIVEGDGVSDRNLSKLHKEKQAIRRKHFGDRSWVFFAGFLWWFAFLVKGIFNAR